MVVLTKLFTRKNKKASEPAAVKKVAPAPQPTVVTVQALVQQSQSEERREQLNALTELAKRLNEGDARLEDLQQAGLAELSLLALRLHQGEALVSGQASAEQWFELAQQGFTAQIRTLAATQLGDAGLIEQLVRVSKGRDKAVYRIAKDKFDVLRDQQKQEEAQIQRLRELVDAMGRHAKASLDPLYASKLKNLAEQWQAAGASTSDELKAEFEHHFKVASERVAEITEAEETVAEQHEMIEAANNERQEIVDRVVQELRERTDSLDLNEEDLREAQLFLTEQQHLWRESEQHSKPGKEEERGFHRLCTAFEASLAKQADIHKRFGPVEALLDRLENTPDKMDAEAHALDEWMHHLDWADNLEPPGLLARVERALSSHHNQLAEHRQHEIQKVRQARGLMRRCMAAVNDGHLKRSSGLLLGCTEALEGLTEKGHPGLFRQFEETKEAVEKLCDWQSFAVQPKKEALIERMQRLTEQSMPPEARANAIRTMQDEWRLLSRGLQNQHQELWEVFHDLAQKAYQPCREFFAEQSKLRSLNLEKRKELVGQLKQYEKLTDWSQPDLKEVDRVMNMARQDWRRFSPVDRAANKAVQQDFDNIYQRIRQHLQQEQSQFREAKQNIIERARSLLELEDSREATEQAKKLQKEWQQAGHLARRDEQALWKEFRAVCDQLFDRRGQQIEAFKADLEQHRQRAEECIKAMQALLEADEPLAQKDQAENLRQQFRNLGTLPKANHKALVDQFDKVSKAFDVSCKSQKEQEKDKHWQALIHWVRSVRFSGIDADQAAATLSALNLPAAARSVEQHLASLKQPETKEQGKDLRRKTIELEVMAAVESPSADKALRMELQVQRLSAGMGQKVTQSDFDQAVVNWLMTPGVSTEDYDLLEPRMQKARAAWLGGSQKN